MLHNLVLKGQQHGVRFVRRGEEGVDDHILVQLMSEDDENWFDSNGQAFSSYWLDDLIEVLTAAKVALVHDAAKDDRWGYKFKPPPGWVMGDEE